EIVVVDEDAVLVLGPLIARAGAAPGAQQIAGSIKQENWRGGRAALGFGRVLLGSTLARRQRERALHHPDAIVFVGCDAGDLTEDPVVRQRLRPEWLDAELGDIVGECRDA